MQNSVVILIPPSMGAIRNAFFEKAFSAHAYFLHHTVGGNVLGLSSDLKGRIHNRSVAINM